jgi:hypothetical protein
LYYLNRGEEKNAEERQKGKTVILLSANHEDDIK